MNAPGLAMSGRATIDGTTIFERLSLDVPPGQWTCLLGPSGVGKSTVLRLFAELDKYIAFEGRVGASDGKPVTGRVALMAQSDLLMPWLSVRDNVLIGAKLRGEASDAARANDVLTRVGLSNHRDKKPNALSGGQRQRVALARTLMEDRPIVLLDEPFSALDAKTRSQMQELAVEVLANKTVLLVTHDPGEAARLGHNIQIMEQGGLTTFAPPAGAVPRRIDDAGMLKAQARLLTILRGEEVAP